MAERYLIGTGDVSDATKWDGGVSVPGVGDDCYANGFTGTLTASKTCLSWRTTAGATAVAGGGFACSTAGVTIGGNIIAGSSVALAISNATGTVTLTGNVTGSTTAGVSAVTKSGAGALSHTGNATGGTFASAAAIAITAGSIGVTGNLLGGSSTTCAGLLVDNSPTVTVTGTVTGGTGSTSAQGIRIATGSPSVTITGDVTGNTADGMSGILGATPTMTVNGAVTGSSGSDSGRGIGMNAGTLTVTGNVTGGSSSSSVATGITTAAGTVTITGDVKGATGSTGVSAGIQNSGATITINGNVIGGTSSSSVGFARGVINTTGTVTVTGYAIGSPSGYASPGILGAPAATTTVGSIRVGATGAQGADGKVFLSNLTTGTLQGINSALTVKTFYPTDFAGLLPTAANVRSGTVYNLTNSTGTLAVPAAGNVLSGVSVDAGTGTYVDVATANVRSGTTFGAASASTGTLAVPSAANVLSGVSVDATTGTYVTVSINDVQSGVTFGAASALTGVFASPTASQVLSGVGYGASSEFTGNVVLPSVGDVESGVTFGPSSGSTGTFVSPPANQVLEGALYGASGEFVGTMVSDDWTSGERAQIRYRLGIDGTHATPTATGHAELDSAAQDEVLQAVSDANQRLDAIAAKTNLINAGRLRVLSRVCGNVITAHAGDDHLLSADNALTLEIDDDDASLYAQLTDTTNQAVTFGAGRANATDADDIVATIPAENFRHDGTSTLIDIELLSADTIGRRGEYEFDIQITNAAGYKITPQPLQGTLIIEMDRKS